MDSIRTPVSMNIYSTRSDTLASRIPRTYQSFICEDKLDKWLDLEKILKFQCQCRSITNWSQYRKFVHDKIINLETISMLSLLSYHPSDISKLILTPLIVAKLQKRLLRSKVMRCHISQAELRRMLETVKRASSKSFTIQIDHILGQTSTAVAAPSIDTCSDFAKKFDEWPPELVTYFCAMEDMLKVLEIRRSIITSVKKKSPMERALIKLGWKDTDHKQRKPNNVIEIPSLEGKLTILPQLAILTFEGSDYLLSDELLLEICNKICEMFCALLTAFMLSGNAHTAEFYSYACQFWKILANMMLKTPIKGLEGYYPENDNKPFAILKVMEGLGVASIMADEDITHGWENTDLQKGMWNSLVDANLVSSKDFLKHELGLLFSKLTTPEKANLIGTVKLLGHPAIELQSGISELYQRTHSNLYVDPAVVRQTQGILIRDIARGYLSRHGELPKVHTLDPQLCPNLISVFKPGFTLASSAGRTSWYAASPEEWSYVKYQQNQEFDQIENQLSIIKDKALGATRTQVEKMLMLNACAIEDVKGSAHTIWEAELQQIRDYVVLDKKKRVELRAAIEDLEETAYDQINQGDDEHQVLADLNLRIAKLSLEYSLPLPKDTLARSLIKRPIRRAERRTLLMYLMEPYFNEKFKKYLSDYQNQTHWDHKVLEHLVIKLTAKELEEKPSGRFFGASGPYERNRRIVQERNVMNLMHSYIPDQLMTPNELQIMKKLVSFRYFNRLYPNHVLFQVSFDFSKWNNNMREESIDVPAGEVLDPWFDTKLYGRTMKAFQNMRIYLSEKSLITGWKGQKGGIEGLNQATWSLVFLAGIKNALEGAGLKYQVTVKGDDVRAVIAVTADEVAESGGYAATRDRIMSRIHGLCASMGWQLNPQESFVSLTLISTSKQYQVRDTWLPASIKKAMKMMSLSNILLPTFEDLIGSIFSTAHSACSQSTVVVPIYAAALVVACSEIYRHLPSRDRTSNRIAFYSLWPQVLGGPGALPLQTFFVRGENDMLAVGIALMLSIIRYYGSSEMTNMALATLGQEIEKSPDASLLITDPYSVPLKIPQRPSAILKKLIQRRLEKWVKNKDIKYLLSHPGLAERQAFIQHLDSMRPYLGKVATAIFENSPFYLLDELLAKFMESPTVVALFANDPRVPRELRLANALTKVLDAAHKRSIHWLQITRKTSTRHLKFPGVTLEDLIDPQVCPTYITRKIRNYSWDRDIMGVTYPSLTTQLKIGLLSEFQSQYPIWDLSDCCINVINRSPESISQTNDISLHYSAAPNQIPWVGSVTEAKVKFPHLTTNIKTATIMKVQKLLVLRMAVADLGKELTDTLNLCLQSLTTTSMNDLAQFQLSGETGHFTHRLAINSFSMETMPNFRSNLLQLLSITTDNLDILKRDTRDRTINFAAINYYTSSICLFPLQFSRDLPPQYPDQMVVMFHPESMTTMEYRMCPDCCHVETDQALITFSKPRDNRMIKYATVPLVGCSGYENRLLAKSLAEFLAKRLVRTIIENRYDAYDEVVLERASIGLLIELAKASVDSAVQTLVENYFQMPSANLADLLSAYSGQVNPYSVSVNVLRSIPPEYLYMGCLAGLVNFFIDKVYTYPHPVALHILSHLNTRESPLKSFFENILRANLLGSIIEGAKKVDLLTRPLNFGAGISSADACAVQFTMQHVPVIRSWLEGNLDLKPVRIYTQWQSADKIADNLEHLYIKRVIWLIKAIMPRGSTPEQPSEYGVIMTDFAVGVALRSGLQDHDLNGPWDDRIIGSISAGMSSEWSKIRNYGGPDPVLRREFLIILPVIIFFDCIIRRGTWVHLEDEDLEQLDIFHLIDSINFNLPPKEIVNLQYVEARLDIIQKILPNWDKRILTCVARSFLEYIEEVDDDEIISIDQAYSVLSRLMRQWNDPLNEIRVCYMTIEESQRILRVNTRNQYHIRTQRHLILEALQEVRDEHEASFLPTQAPLSECPYQSNAWHEYRLHNIAITPEPDSGHVSRGILNAAWSLDDYRPPTTLLADQREILRCVGRHNTSVAKYTELWAKLGLDRHTLHYQNPRPKVCLADGLGGVTAVLSEICPYASVLFNTLRFLRRTGSVPADASRSGYPIELLDPTFNETHRVRVKHLTTPTGDLSDRETQAIIINRPEWLRARPDLITMDADIDWSQPLEKYHDLLFGVLRIVGAITESDTWIFIKTFLVNHWVIEKFLMSCYALFAHVHIERSPCTRSHSLEIIVAMTRPRDLINLPHITKMLQNPDMNIPYHQRLHEMIRIDVTPIANSYVTFRASGEYTYSFNPDLVYEKYLRLRVYPLSTATIMKWVGAADVSVQTKLCNWLDTLKEQLDISLKEWEILHALVPISLLTEREQLSMSTPESGRVPVKCIFLRRGWQRRRLACLRYIKLQSFKVFTMNINVMNRGLLQGEIDACMHQILVSVLLHLQQVGLGSRFRAVLKGNQLIFDDFRHSINVTDVIRQAYIKALQYFGILTYCAYVYRHCNDITVTNHLIKCANPCLVMNRQFAVEWLQRLTLHKDSCTAGVAFHTNMIDIIDYLRIITNVKPNRQLIDTFIGPQVVSDTLDDVDDHVLAEQLEHEAVYEWPMNEANDD